MIENTLYDINSLNIFTYLLDKEKRLVVLNELKEECKRDVLWLNIVIDAATNTKGSAEDFTQVTEILLKEPLGLKILEGFIANPLFPEQVLNSLIDSHFCIESDHKHSLQRFLEKLGQESDYDKTMSSTERKYLATDNLSIFQFGQFVKSHLDNQWFVLKIAEYLYDYSSGDANICWGLIRKSKHFYRVIQIATDKTLNRIKNLLQKQIPSLDVKLYNLKNTPDKLNVRPDAEKFLFVPSPLEELVGFQIYVYKNEAIAELPNYHSHFYIDILKGKDFSELIDFIVSFIQEEKILCFHQDKKSAGIYSSKDKVADATCFKWTQKLATIF